MRLTSAESSRCATFLSRRSNAVLSKVFFWYPSITRTVPSPSFFANSVLSKVLSVPICSPCSLPSSSRTLTSSFGWSRPYPFRSFSSARSFFCFRVDREATSESTALSSPSASTGCASFQPFSPFVRRTTSWPSFARRSSFTWALSKSNSFSLFSFASAFFCSSLPAQSANPAMPPATSSSASRPTSVFVVCFMARSPALAGLPDHQTGEEQPEGEQVEGEEGHRTLLLGREEQVVALALLWPDGDARLRSEEHTSELQSRFDLVCRLLLEKKKKKNMTHSFDDSAKLLILKFVSIYHNFYDISVLYRFPDLLYTFL